MPDGMGLGDTLRGWREAPQGARKRSLHKCAILFKNRVMDTEKITDALEVELQKKQIAEWVKEGSTAGKNRKERNHALIQMGLAVQAMVEKKEIDPKSVLRHVIINKQELVKKWLTSKQ